MTRCLGIFAVLILNLVSMDAEARRVPKEQGSIVDQTGLLTPQDIRTLRSGMTSLEGIYSAKLRVLVIPSLHDDVLEKFSGKVARRWQFDEHQDGILLVVSMREREFYVQSFGKLRKAINTRTLQAMDKLIFTAGNSPEIHVSTSAWLEVFDGLCAEAFIPEIRLGRREVQSSQERPWVRWLDFPLVLLALIWLVLRLKRVRMGEFRHKNVDQGWTSIDRESTFGGGTSSHGSFGGGGGSASWGRRHS